MNSTLEDLYSGNLNPQEDADETYARTFRRRKEYFRECLQGKDPELEKSFDVMMEDLSQCYYLTMEEMFLHGFGLAVKLLAEGLSYS